MNLAHLDSAVNTGDNRLLAWALAWVANAIAHRLPVFDANMFYPAPMSLAQTDHFVALGLLGMPLWLATGNAMLVFNVLQLLGPAVTSFSAFLLFRSWTGESLTSLVGGLSFGISFFALLHNGHIFLTWAAGIPLAMLLFERWWSHPTWPRIAALWTVCLFTALTSSYLAVLLATVLAVQMIVTLIRRRPPDASAAVTQVIAGIALGAAVLLPFVTPYLGRLNAPTEASTIGAADLSSYVVPPENTVLGRFLVSRGFVPAMSIWGEKTLYLGWITIVLAGIGVMAGLHAPDAERRWQTRLLLALLVVGALLSFGPSATGLAPFDLLAHLPILRGFRAAGRFGLIVSFAVAGLAVFGLHPLRDRLRRMASFGMVALLALMMAERFVVDFPPGHPQPESMPEIYTLARHDNARAVVALPMYAGQPGWFFETDYLLYSTAADFIPLANGYGRWATSEYLGIAEAMRTFPSVSSADALRFYGVSHVIVHTTRLGEKAAAILAQLRLSRDYAIASERGPDLLLRVAVH